MRPLRSPLTRFRWRASRDGTLSFSNYASPLLPFFRSRTIPGFRGLPALLAPVWRLRDQTIAAPQNLPFASRATLRCASGDRAPWYLRSGRNPPACAGRVTFASFRRRHRHGCIEPGLKFAATGGDRARKLIQFQTEHRHHFAIVKFIEIIEGEGAALWFRCSRNPNRQLFRFELLDLFRRLRRNFGRLVRPLLWLHPVGNDIEATPARFAKKPVAIRRRLATGGKKRSLSQSVLKNILRFRRLTRH